MKGTLTLLFCFLLINTTRAQVCTGSLGDPIFTEDFGSGSGRYGPSIGAYTNYNYATATPNDGSYAITNSTQGFNNNWYNITDHTGNGYMMVVNASISKTDYFYKRTVPDLCPGTTYEFSAYILNLIVNNGIRPDITFRITDATGKVYNTPTGPIPNGNSSWLKYGITFTTPATGGDVVLTMINNADGGGGNDLALDDIAFRPCGPVITSSFISTGTPTLPACSGGTQSFTMNAAPGPGYVSPAYQWQKYVNGIWVDITGENAGEKTTSYTAKFTPAIAGSYQYRLASAEAINISSVKCRVISNVLTLTINDPPSSAITGSTTVCQGEPIMLSAAAGDSYSWTGPNGYTSTQQIVTIPAATLANAGTYNLVVKKFGCATNGSVVVNVNAKPVAAAGGGGNICEGSSVPLQATGGVSYLWSPAAGLSNPSSANPVASPANTTTYTVTVTNASGCISTASTTVTVIKAPVVNAGEDIKMTEGQAITLNGEITGDSYTFFWTPATGLSSTTVKTPMATPTADITYTLHAIDGNGCGFDITDEVFIRVYKKVVVPNTFTPNNDGINDTWGIEALETYPAAFTQVFNRYGILVYQTTGYSKPWDGRHNGLPLPSGTYYYKIDLKNGTGLSGPVTILR